MHQLQPEINDCFTCYFLFEKDKSGYTFTSKKVYADGKITISIWNTVFSEPYMETKWSIQIQKCMKIMNYSIIPAI